MGKIYLANRVYIPRSKVDMEKIKKGYERHIYKEHICARCDNRFNRFNDVCAVCPAHTGFFATWKKETIDEKLYIGLPIGDRQKVKKYTGISFKDANVIDLRSNVKAKYPLRFTKKLRDGTEIINNTKTADQKQIARDFWQFKNGMIKARARTGKTVVATYLICKFKRRVLFVANEKEFLRQGIRTVREFTNVRELEKKHGKKLIGIIQTASDWKEDWDIVFCTYQKFIHPKTGYKNVRKYVKKKFGFLVVDEAHRGAATAFCHFLAKMDMKYRLALTATDKRKDQLDFLVEQFLGPVVAEDDTPAMIPNIKVHYTKLKPPYEWRGVTAYVKATSWLAEHEERNKILVRQVFKDLRENSKHCIVIPVLRVGQAKILTDMINDQAAYNNEHKNENWSIQLALALYDKCNPSRNYVMEAARKATETRVIVSIVKMVREGVNVEPWTHLYLQFPMSNEPNFYQMSQRICTPYEGKPQPVLRMYADNIGLSLGCFTSTWKHMLHNKYNVDEETRKKAYDIMKHKSVKAKEENTRSSW